jgi:hypothetical protein
MRPEDQMSNTTKTRTDYSRYVLRVDWEQYYPAPETQGMNRKVDLTIERVEDPKFQNLDCDHCTDNVAEYIVHAEEHGGFDMAYCQDYMDMAYYDPSYPDEFVYFAHCIVCGVDRTSYQDDFGRAACQEHASALEFAPSGAHIRGEEI